MDILSLIRRLPEIVTYNQFDDDLYDRLNYSHTVAILTIFAIMLTHRQFSDNQIKCWVPAQFTGSYEQYVNRICFITNTYSFDMYESLPDDYEQRHEHELKYYQWTPFILLLMAILFYLPHQCWRGLSLRSGVDLKDLIEAAQTYRSANIRREDKIKLLDYMINWLNSYCSNSHRLTMFQKTKSLTRKAKFIRRGHHILFPIGIYTGNYLMISYLFTKFLYLLNSIGQILLLNVLLGRNFWFYGIEAIYQYWTKRIDLLNTGSSYFPKVVLCDFSIREPNHPKESHRYTVQCVLSFNLFNQQLFTYIYFWLIILSCFNFTSIVIWLYRMLPQHNFNYLQRRLSLHAVTHEHHDEIDLRRKFVYQYLQGDGTFMLRLIASNVSDYVCQKIVIELYRNFFQHLNLNTFDRRFSLKSIVNSNHDHDNNDQEKSNKQNDNDVTVEDDDGSTDQTMAADLPPLPNPRQGKLLVERDVSQRPSADLIDNGENESQGADSISVPTNGSHSQIHLRSSLVPTAKETSQPSDAQIDSSDAAILHYKNIEFNQEPTPPLSSTLSSPTIPPLERLPSLPTTKGPSPYATTYLTSKKRNEHELPYIDDSISSGSTSGRLTTTTVFRQKEKRPTTLASTNVFFRRSHDV